MTARLKDDPTFYAMEAILKPDGDWGQIFLLEIKAATGNDGKAGSVRWKLDYISKIDDNVL